jgi:hypothetical protein
VILGHAIVSQIYLSHKAKKAEKKESQKVEIPKSDVTEPFNLRQELQTSRANFYGNVAQNTYKDVRQN